MMSQISKLQEKIIFNRKWIWCVIIGCLFTPMLLAQTILPPIVTLRDIAKMPRQAKGEIVKFDEHTTLFIPEGYKIPATGAITLAVHFHGADWFAMEEHARRGALNPLLIYWGFEGSSNYEKPFKDGKLFGQLIKKTEDRLKTHVADVEISSFSAGFGAVREILKSPEYVKLIKTIVLADSCVASFAVLGGGKDRKPDAEQMAPFINYARLAADGRKNFVMSFCQMGRPFYASPSDTARAIVAGVDGELKTVRKNAILAANYTMQYPLLFHYDKAGLHVWGYGGRDVKAHMAQARAVADFYAALEHPLPAEAVPVAYTRDRDEATTRPRNPIPPARRNVPGKHFILPSRHQVYVPDYFKPDLTTQTCFVVFFHGAAWCSEQNLYDSRKNAVLVSISEGRMENYVKWGEQLLPLLREVQKRLADDGVTSKPIGPLCIASFSGGYGAIKSILSEPEYTPLISDVVLADSLYPSRAEGDKNAVDPDAMEPILKCARRAAEGKVGFWFSHLYPPEAAYRDNTSTLAAAYLIDKLGLPKYHAAGYTSRGSQIMYRAERGRLHIFGYGGMTTQDHFEHFYALSDLLRRTSLPSAP